MSTTDLSNLPFLLTYSQVRSLGISRRMLRAAVEGGAITYTTTPAGGRRRYHKHRVLMFLGFTSIEELEKWKR